MLVGRDVDPLGGGCGDAVAEFYFCPLGTALPQVRDGKPLALAVSGPKRAALLPDVPSVLELFPNSDYPFWIGIFMPAKTPSLDIIEKFHRESVTTMQFPNVKEHLETLGMEPMPLTPSSTRTCGRKSAPPACSPMLRGSSQTNDSKPRKHSASRYQPSTRWRPKADIWRRRSTDHPGRH